MGLDVGAVRIEYLNRPNGPAHEFLRYLIHNSHEADWGFSSSENVIAEYTRVGMLAQVDTCVEDGRLRPNDKALILNWVYGLPWNRDTVMLHFGW